MNDNIVYTHRHRAFCYKSRIICTNKITHHVNGEGATAEYVVLYYDGIKELIYETSKEEFEKLFVKIQPYESCKIDDPVYVKMFSSDTWHKRHFAGISDDGQPLFWSDGCTSFTVYNSATVEAIECYPVDQAPEDVVKCAVA